MRYRVIALFSIALCALALTAPAGAQDTAKPTSQDTPKTDVKGLFLLTDFPAISLRPGSSSTVNLRLQNYSLPPERLVLSIAGVPQGWTATLIGGGQPIQAALPATNANVALELRLDVPKEAPMGTTNLTVTRQGREHRHLAADRRDDWRRICRPSSRSRRSFRTCAATRNRPSNISSASRTRAARR